ncbi:predicted protein [Chaetoceros tenuissimus]|uniref:Uncharacterized protein n=1 Tax=Chaetoceros tenuissimus TaxID=426638 RepID=A0AAD3CRM8_9STRA|nr:predicted protein [Chaetoceros tenuissimus]
MNTNLSRSILKKSYDLRRLPHEGKPSKTMMKSKDAYRLIKGDGDCWREIVCCNPNNPSEEHFVCFESEKTGRKIAEPPTGASKVIYLKDAVREKRLKGCDHKRKNRISSMYKRK